MCLFVSGQEEAWRMSNITVPKIIVSITHTVHHFYTCNRYKKCYEFPMLTLTYTYLWSLAWTEGDLCRAWYIVLPWIGRRWFWQAGGAPHHWCVGEVRPHPYDLQLYVTSILIEMVVRQGPVNAWLWMERKRIHLNKCQQSPIDRWLIISHTNFIFYIIQFFKIY